MPILVDPKQISVDFKSESKKKKKKPKPNQTKTKQKTKNKNLRLFLLPFQIFYLPLYNFSSFLLNFHPFSLFYLPPFSRYSKNFPVRSLGGHSAPRLLRHWAILNNRASFHIRVIHGVECNLKESTVA